MRIQIEPTESIVAIDGVECRVWNGITDSGVQCFLFVHRVAVHEVNDQQQFQQELYSAPMPKGLSVQ